MYAIRIVLTGSSTACVNKAYQIDEAHVRLRKNQVDGAQVRLRRVAAD